MRNWGVWAAAVAISCLSGCGTASNFYGPAPANLVYGGVRNDWAALKLATTTEAPMTWPYLPFVAVDLPLSAVGDTLTLPYTLFVNSDLFRHDFFSPPTDEFLAEMNSAPRFPSSSGAP